MDRLKRQEERLFTYLKTQFGYTGIKPLSCGFHSDQINALYTCQSREGKPLFVKVCMVAALSRNEYHSGRQLWELDPRHFAQPHSWHEGRPFSFCACDYLPGTRLYDALMEGRLSPEEKGRFVEDLYEMFLALKKSDILHRDIQSPNIIIHKGRLILIDFQMSASKTHFKELPVYKNILAVATFRGHHQYHRFIWDDAYSLLHVLKEIGPEKLYAERYKEIYHEIEAHIGKESRPCVMPSLCFLVFKCFDSLVKSTFYSGQKKRRYLERLQLYQKILRYARNKT